MPGDRERDRRIQQRAEIVSVMRVLPEVVGIDQQGTCDRLLKAGIELIAVSGASGAAVAPNTFRGESASPGSARKQEIFVEWVSSSWRRRPSRTVPVCLICRRFPGGAAAGFSAINRRNGRSENRE